MTISGFVEYVKQIWKNKPDRTTPITAAALTHIEDGIKGNSDAINKIAQAVVDNIVNDPQKIASMAALYAVNESVKKNATAIETVNNNLSKCLQYIHSETDVFDFNDPQTPAGYHRLGAAASYKNAPSGLDGVNFCTVEVVRPTISDTLAMTIYPYKKGINPPVWYKSGGSNEWPTLPWNVYATKSDLYPSYDQITLFSDVKSDVTDKNITIAENGMVQVAAKTQAIDGTAFIRLVINGACVYEGHTVSGKYRYLWTPIFPVKKGDIIKVTLQTGTTDGQRFVYFYKS